jgi:hypothetical protein
MASTANVSWELVDIYLYMDWKIIRSYHPYLDTDTILTALCDSKDSRAEVNLIQTCRSNSYPLPCLPPLRLVLTDAKTRLEKILFSHMMPTRLLERGTETRL